jgi:hypothetical protein
VFSRQSRFILDQTTAEIGNEVSVESTGRDFAERVANYSRRAWQFAKQSLGERRLRQGAAYASAAGAALAGASAAEADIVWSGLVNHTVSINGNSPSTAQLINFDIAPGIQLFASLSRYAYYSSFVSQFARIYRAGSSLGFAGGDFSPVAYDADDPFNGPFNAGNVNIAHPNGGFNVANGEVFVGFQLNLDGLQKGWLRMSWGDLTGDNRPDTITVHEWAYAGNGEAILAGDRGLAAVPEAGAAALVGLVASGAVGVVALKKRRKAA